MVSLVNKDILIIEDNPEMQALLKKILEPSGARLHIHHCVKDGLKVAQANALHLVLLDINLSYLSGLDYFKVRKNFPNLVDVPVIVVSGSNDPETISKSIALGASDYLLKPFKATMLINKIRKQLADCEVLSVNLMSEHGTLKSKIIHSGSITGVSPIHVQVEAPIKLASNQMVEITSKVLSDLELDHVKFKTTSHKSLYTDQGRFQKSIQFVGITAAQAKEIRIRIGRLKS